MCPSKRGITRTGRDCAARWWTLHLLSHWRLSSAGDRRSSGSSNGGLRAARKQVLHSCLALVCSCSCSILDIDPRPQAAGGARSRQCGVTDTNAPSTHRASPMTVHGLTYPSTSSGVRNGRSLLCGAAGPPRRAAPTP